MNKIVADTSNQGNAGATLVVAPGRQTKEGKKKHGA
jgi:hypothetical protein